MHRMRGDMNKIRLTKNSTRFFVENKVTINLIRTMEVVQTMSTEMYVVRTDNMAYMSRYMFM